MNEDEESCYVCGKRLEPGDGRYNLSHGTACIDCYSPSLCLGKAAEGDANAHPRSTLGDGAE